MQKLKLYNGKTLPGFTEDNVKELREEAKREGMHGHQPALRAGQDLQRPGRPSRRTVDQPLHGAERAGSRAAAPLAHHQRGARASTTGELLAVVKREYEDIVKNEVQRAIAADEDASDPPLRQLHRQRQGLHASARRSSNRYTGQTEEPDERLMRSIEEKIDIPESRKDDFRREIMNYIGALAIDGKKFDYKTNERLPEGAGAQAVRGPEGHDQAHEPGLQRRRQGHAGEDRHRQGAPDPQLRLQRRLARPTCLNYVASIFARGDVKRGSH